MSSIADIKDKLYPLQLKKRPYEGPIEGTPAELHPSNIDMSTRDRLLTNSGIPIPEHHGGGIPLSEILDDREQYNECCNHAMKELARSRELVIPSVLIGSCWVHYLWKAIGHMEDSDEKAICLILKALGQTTDDYVIQYEYGSIVWYRRIASMAEFLSAEKECEGELFVSVMVDYSCDNNRMIIPFEPIQERVISGKRRKIDHSNNEVDKSDQVTVYSEKDILAMYGVESDDDSDQTETDSDYDMEEN